MGQEPPMQPPPPPQQPPGGQGQPMGGQQYGGQPAGGQPYGGQPMGGQQYGGGPPMGGMGGMGGMALRATEWWKRFVAAIIDWLIIVLPSWILGPAIFGGMFSTPQISINPDTGAIETGGAFGRMMAAQGALALMTLIIGVAYFVYFHGSTGQTLGKKLMNIKVVNIDSGQTIDYGKAFVRWLIPGLGGSVTCGILPLLDGLWPLWDSRGQALHDKLANTLVIDV